MSTTQSAAHMQAQSHRLGVSGSRLHHFARECGSATSCARFSQQTALRRSHTARARLGSSGSGSEKAEQWVESNVFLHLLRSLTARSFELRPRVHCTALPTISYATPTMTPVGVPPVSWLHQSGYPDCVRRTMSHIGCSSFVQGEIRSSAQTIDRRVRRFCIGVQLGSKVINQACCAPAFDCSTEDAKTKVGQVVSIVRRVGEQERDATGNPAICSRS
jgi:hypothetical protein